MKRKLIALTSVVMASALMSTSAYAANVSIVIDGNTVESDTEPQITAEGRTIVPLRVISEELGAKVDWDAETKTVTVEKQNSTLKLTIGENVMTDNGSEIKLDSPAQIVNERTMVPLRAISESFGCNVDWDAETKTVIIATDAVSEAKEETYKSKDGWSVKYNSALVKVNEGDDEVSFVYTGKSAGTTMLAISYVKDKMPQEVLGEKTADWDSEKTTRTEGYFAGENWAFFRDLTPDGGVGMYQGYIAAEYNGGTLLVEHISHVGENESDEDTLVSDTMSAVIDSIEFDNFKPQTQFEYVPGTYTRTYTDEIGGTKVEKTDSVKLEKDHTAVLEFQDEIEGLWDSTGIRVDNKTYYEYAIEGDTLRLKIDDEWIEFSKGSDKKDESGEKESVYEQDEKAYAEVISDLKKGDNYAFAAIGKKNDALLTTDGVYDDLEGNMAAISATVYGFDKNGKIKNYGEVESSGTAYPLSVKDGYLYVAGKVSVRKYYIDEASSELMAAEYAYGEFDKDGNATYYYSKDGKKEEADENGDELTRLFDEYMNATIVSFTEAK